MNEDLHKAKPEENYGNAAALRDAVIKALTLLCVCDWPSGVSLDVVREVIHEIDSVLDKPSRNCDVGTGDEQLERFNRFCGRCEDGCPLAECETIVECVIKWGQLPYEKGGES